MIKYTVLSVALFGIACGAAYAEDSVLSSTSFKMQDKADFVASIKAQDKQAQMTNAQLREATRKAYQEKSDQHFMSVHAEKGVSCVTCHDPRSVKSPEWMASVSNPKVKQNCQDCHVTQAAVVAKTDTHSNQDCISCHMPNVSSAANYSNDQKDAAKNAVRRIHTYKINVDPKATTMVKTEKGYELAKDAEGHAFVDLMWSCARNTPADYTVFEGKGCHSPETSKLDPGLMYKDQKTVYGELVRWQAPIKESYKDIASGIKRIQKLLEVTKLDRDARAQVLAYLDQAQQIADLLEKDGSWGAHAHNYLAERGATGEQYIRQAQQILDGGSFVKTSK